MLVKYRHDVRPLPIPNPFPTSSKTGNQGTCPAGWNTHRGPGSERGMMAGIMASRPGSNGCVQRKVSSSSAANLPPPLSTAVVASKRRLAAANHPGSPPPWPWPAVACLELVHKSMASFPPSPRFLGTARSCHDLRISGRSLLNPLCDSPARQKGLLA